MQTRVPTSTVTRSMAARLHPVAMSQPTPLSSSILFNTREQRGRGSSVSLSKSFTLAKVGSDKPITPVHGSQSYDFNLSPINNRSRSDNNQSIPCNSPMQNTSNTNSSLLPSTPCTEKPSSKVSDPFNSTELVDPPGSVDKSSQSDSTLPSFNMYYASHTGPEQMSSNLTHSALSIEGAKLDRLIGLVESNSKSISAFTDFKSSKTSDDEKTDKLMSLLQDNVTTIGQLNDRFSSLRSRIDASSLECHERINLLESKFDSEFTVVNDNLDGAFGYVDNRMDLIFTAKSDAINLQFSEASVATDAKIEKHVSDLRSETETKLGTISSRLENKLDSYNRSVGTTIQFEVDKYLENTGVTRDIESLTRSLTSTVQTEVEKYLEALNIDEVIQKEIARRLGDKPLPSEPETDQIASLDDRLTQAVAEISQLKSSLEFMTDRDVQTAHPSVEHSDISAIHRKIDSLTNWLSAFQVQQRAKNTLVDTLDLKLRANNLIIDGMAESPQEDTLFLINQFLSRFVPRFDGRNLITAHRIGKFLPDRPPRRIFISLTPGPARQQILTCAGAIAKAGLPGSRVYINEDVPEGAKRRKADAYKYVEYLKEKGVKAVQKGENVLIDDRLYKFDELRNMPDGFTLKDSRTIKKNGVVAFQSSHSPLSNLYLSPIKRNGITYASAEHAFQHAKAVTCKDQALARSILDEPSSYEALYTGKRVLPNEEWLRLQLGVMEEIVQMKYEQVPAFQAELRATESHHLVENARCSFWGAGTAYSAPSIFSRSYPGFNHLGKLLEKVRDNF